MAVKHIISDNNGGTRLVKLTAKKAIITYCKECMGFQSHEVRKCTYILCPLFPFRTHDPAKDSV